MKKKLLVTSLCIFLGLASSCQIGNDQKKEVRAKTNQELARNTQEPIKPKTKVFEDFIYDIGTRFVSIKKSEIENAKTIEAFFNEEELQKMESIISINVIQVIDDKQSEIRETGTTKELTKTQLNLLQNFSYGTNFVIRADFKQINKTTGELKDNYATPHLTIVPEKQAIFVDGKEALKAFLKMSTEEVRKNVDPEKLKPAKLFFTVTKNGTIENVHLDRSSGYPEVDKKMMELITKVPGTWLPAENINGDKVDQELVVSFGLLGC